MLACSPRVFSRGAMVWRVRRMGETHRLTCPRSRGVTRWGSDCAWAWPVSVRGAPGMAVSRARRRLASVCPWRIRISCIWPIVSVGLAGVLGGWGVVCAWWCWSGFRRRIVVFLLLCGRGGRLVGSLLLLGRLVRLGSRAGVRPCVGRGLCWVVVRGGSRWCVRWLVRWRCVGVRRLARLGVGFGCLFG